MRNTQPFDLSQLPATGKTTPGTRFVGIFLMFFALLWGGMPTAILIGAIVKGAFEPAMLFMMIFSVIGTALFILGLWLASRKVVTTIHADRVEQTRKSIFGRDAWQESLSAYPGIVYRSEYHSGGKNHSSYTLYIVELHHLDSKKRIKLYSARSEHGIRKIWEDCCRQLQLPALQDDGGTMTARATEDLDKSVKELAAEGKIDVNFDASAPPPEGLQLKVEQGKLRIEVLASPTPIWGVLIALGIPGLFVGLGFFGPAPIIFGIFGAVFMAIFAAAMLHSWLTNEVIELDSTGIKLLRTSKRGDSKGTFIASESVESVTVGSSDGQQQKTVRIETDSATHKAGQGLKIEALNWLRDCILTVLIR